MRFALVQLNSLVGAPQENAARILQWVDKNKDAASIFIFPELSLIGYPCRDLLSQPKLFVEEEKAFQSLLEYTARTPVTLIIGHTTPGTALKPRYNSASLLKGGQVVGRVSKHRIPAYDIFEEERFFASAPAQNHVFDIDGTRVGVFICEDAWGSTQGFGRQDVRAYKDSFDPAQYLKGAEVIVNLSASPFSWGKRNVREDLFSALAQRCQRPLLYVNCVGGQDDILFDGASFALNAAGEMIASAPAFEEKALIVDTAQTTPVPAESSSWETLRQALVLGIRDYVHKTGAAKVLLGLSGGIDSTLCACLAAEALGAPNVLGVTLSSAVTSKESVEDAHELARNLGIEVRDHHIQKIVDDARGELHFQGEGLPLENLQVRARALLLMGLSNIENRLLLSTANKSEIAMGYGTLYGDLCGALMPLGDLFKTEVFGLSHYLNLVDIAQAKKPRIPWRCLSKAPSAELRTGQKDEDSLPVYEKLDVFLSDYLHNSGQLRGKVDNWNTFLAPNHNVEGLLRKIQSQEFKRRQAPPILRVHERAFGQGWRMPLAKGFLA